ncbi:MAG TPA: hypothetical protein VHL11_19000 [Phototrophicaceae bacterium]|jgi:hypothetical protein|nr:hypothetical protein [Phototrophicaceae bacterium]
MIYKVSYVVQTGDYPGGIKNEDQYPQPGMKVRIGLQDFEIVEVHDIMPPRDNFQFLHAMVKPLEEDTAHV